MGKEEGYGASRMAEELSGNTEDPMQLQYNDKFFLCMTLDKWLSSQLPFLRAQQ